MLWRDLTVELSEPNATAGYMFSLTFLMHSWIGRVSVFVYSLLYISLLYSFRVHEATVPKLLSSRLDARLKHRIASNPEFLRSLSYSLMNILYVSLSVTSSHL